MNMNILLQRIMASLLTVLICALFCTSCSGLRQFTMSLLQAPPRTPKPGGPSPTPSLSEEEQFKLIIERIIADDVSTVDQMLKDNPALAKKLDQDENTLLHYAVWIGDTRLVKVILDRGGDINAKNRLNFTPLHDLCRREESNETKDILVLFIEHEAQVNALTQYGNTALDIAEIKGRTECTRIIRHNGGKRSKHALNLPPVPQFMRDRQEI
jgi:ankyrin repeat protein